MGLPVHRGPTDLAYLNLFLNEMILPNLTGIKETTKAASARLGIRLMDLFGDQMTSPKTPEKPAARARQIHMMPTNGIGLGHAQRCVQIANAMPKGIKPDFLAFPSCLPMITKAGFTGTSQDCGDAPPKEMSSSLTEDMCSTACFEPSSRKNWPRSGSEEVSGEKDRTTGSRWTARNTSTA